MADVKLFLSTVSDEFKNYREALRHALDRPNVTVKIQEDFIVSGTLTLEMLDDYVRSCDGVIHLVGDMTGSAARPQSLDAIGKRYPDLATRLPPLTACLEQEGPPLSYTQWEAWLALLHGRRLFIAVPAAEAPRHAGYVRDPVQQDQQAEHLKRLRRIERYPGVTFTSADHLAWRVLQSFVLDLLVEAGLSRRPSTLPYLPLPENLFTGRASALERLRELLGPIPISAQAPSAVVALHGLGGVGKSRLAIEHAWRQAARHTVVLFVSAQTPEALARNLAALCSAAALDLPQKAACEEEEKGLAVIAWLHTHPGWLLILDGIDTQAGAEAVEALLPRLSGGHVLLASRLSRWSAAIQRLPVEVLEPNEAARFLLARTEATRRRAPDDGEHATAIAEDLEGLALALEHAGAYIDERRLSLARYRQEWSERREKVLAWHDPQLMQYPASVAVTWLTTFEELGVYARELLRLVAWLAPDPIPESLLNLLLPTGEEQESPVLDAWEALVELDRYSLVLRSGQGESFVLHRLVQEVGRQLQRQLPETNRLDAALRWIDAAFAGDPQNVLSWHVLDPLVSHARSVTGFAVQQRIASPTARLLHQVGTLYSAKAAYEQAGTLLRQALAINEATWGQNHPETATNLNNLALLLQTTNHLMEAESLMRRALVIDESTYGSDSVKVATDLCNLSLVLQDTNRLSEAEVLVRRALGILETTRSPVRQELATCLNNLAQLLKDTSRLEEAEQLYLRALQIDETIHGLDHPDVARDLNNLAQLLMASNRLEEAEPLIYRSLAIFEDKLGPNHPIVGTLLNNKAALLQATNRLAEAEPIYRRALAIDEISCGPYHPNVARDAHNLASLLKATKRLAEAEPLMRRSFSIFLKSFGLDHPDTQAMGSNYIVLLQESGLSGHAIQEKIATLSSEEERE